MKIFIILDNGKSDYDAGGIYYAAFSTREAAEKELEKYDKRDREYFEIIEEDI